MIYRSLRLASSLLLLCTFAVAADSPQVEAARRSLQRSLGPRAAEIQLGVMPARDDRTNEFIIEAANGKLAVLGTSPVAMCRGVYHYLRATGTGMATWSGTRFAVPETWPDFPRTRIRTPHKYIQNFNVVTFGYNTVFWDWARWEKELDWMALHGFNMALALNGSEAIWQRVFLQMGLTQGELDHWVTGAAYLPWFRMGNIYKWGGPLSQPWHRDQIALQKKILARMRELGIEPIAPAFAGFVPEALARVYPQEKLILMKEWSGFTEEYVSTILDPQSKLYPEIGRRFIREWEKEFGDAQFFLADSFNEMQVPVPEDRAQRLETLARFGRAVYDSIIAGDESAIWVMQGWLFSNAQDFWDKGSVEALLSRVPSDRMVILDLATNYAETWRMNNAFFDKRWIFSFIPNMGGNTAWVGKMNVSASLAAHALDDPRHGNLIGFGVAYEGIENNDVQTELMTDAAWQQDAIHLDDWLRDYAKARYGKVPPEVIRAWRMISLTAYDHFDSNMRAGYQHRPPEMKWEWGGRPAENAAFNMAVADFLRAGDTLGNEPLYRTDMIEMVAQATGAKIDLLLQRTMKAQDEKKIDERRKLLFEALSLMSDLDALLAAHPTYRVDRWINFARKAGTTPAEKDRYEVMAKRQITQWGPGEHLLNEYAAKVWNGLIAGYYRARWEAYFDALDKGADPKKSLDALETSWIETVGNIPAPKPPADPVKAARELFARANN